MASLSQHITTRLKLLPELLVVLSQVWIFLFVIGYFASIFYAIPVDWVAEERIRWTGMMLQVTGLFMVIIGIAETRKRFKLPLLSAEICDWWKRFKRGPKTVIKAAIVEGVDSVSATGYATGKVSAKNKDDLESRVMVLEAKVMLLSERITDARKHVDNRSKGLESKLQEARDELLHKNKELSELLTLAHTGGLNIELVGAFWLITGVFLATASKELAAYF